MSNTATNMENNSNNSGPLKIDYQSIIQRAKDIIINPEGTLGVIRNENTTIPEIYKKYLLLIAAVGPLFMWIKTSIIGTGAGGVTYRAPFFSGLIHFILEYAVSLVSIYAGAMILEKLAPKFEGTANINNTFKLLAYGITPAVLANVFLVIPTLGWLVLIAGGVYSIHIIYNALPKFVEVPETKRPAYIAASIISCMVVNIVLYGIVNIIVPVS